MPQCPVCDTPVEREGFFCSYKDWLHWVLVQAAQGNLIVHMENYVDLQDQPFYDTLVLGIERG